MRNAVLCDRPRLQTRSLFAHVELPFQRTDRIKKVASSCCLSVGRERDRKSNVTRENEGLGEGGREEGVVARVKMGVFGDRLGDDYFLICSPR